MRARHLCAPLLVATTTLACITDTGFSARPLSSLPRLPPAPPTASTSLLDLRADRLTDRSAIGRILGRRAEVLGRRWFVLHVSLASLAVKEPLSIRSVTFRGAGNDRSPLAPDELALLVSLGPETLARAVEAGRPKGPEATAGEFERHPNKVIDGSPLPWTAESASFVGFLLFAALAGENLEGKADRAYAEKAWGDVGEKTSIPSELSPGEERALVLVFRPAEVTEMSPPELVVRYSMPDGLEHEVSTPIVRY